MAHEKDHKSSERRYKIILQHTSRKIRRRDMPFQNQHGGRPSSISDTYAHHFPPPSKHVKKLAMVFPKSKSSSHRWQPGVCSWLQTEPGQVWHSQHFAFTLKAQLTPLSNDKTLRVGFTVLKTHKLRERISSGNPESHPLLHKRMGSPAALLQLAN